MNERSDDLEPGVALVTGGALRIGRAIALSLGARGWRVAVHYRQSAVEAQEVVAEIEASGGRAMAIQADLADEDEAGSLISRIGQTLGTVTCLINNASEFEKDTIETVTRESWDRHIAINLRAPLVLTQAFAAALDSAGATGNVINMLDQRIWKLTPVFLSYTVSKTGLWTLTQTLAQALAPRVRVNAIGPGPTLPSKRQSHQHFAAQTEAVLLGHGATPDEICRAVQFILDAPSLTGQMIALDGGQHLAWRTPDIINAKE
ncbi:MAG: SDR family oxidoreductase [Sphingomonadales bacterium]